MECSVADCPKKPTARGLCVTHYGRWRRTGSTELLPYKNQRGLTGEQRFWAKVEKTDGCWIWHGAKQTGGYGRFWVDYKCRVYAFAHRHSYEIHIGPIPEGFVIDHLCSNRTCVNPDHLEAVTNRENLLRSHLRRTHCRNGHEYTPENTGRNPDGTRLCLICRRNSIARAVQKQRETALRLRVKG